MHSSSSGYIGAAVLRGNSNPDRKLPERYYCGAAESRGNGQQPPQKYNVLQRIARLSLESKEKEQQTKQTPTVATSTNKTSSSSSSTKDTSTFVKPTSLIQQASATVPLTTGGPIIESGGSNAGNEKISQHQSDPTQQATYQQQQPLQQHQSQMQQQSQSSYYQQSVGSSQPPPTYATDPKDYVEQHHPQMRQPTSMNMPPGTVSHSGGRGDIGKNAWRLQDFFNNIF